MTHSKLTETKILAKIRLAISRLPGCVFWRNSRGMHIVDGRKINYGLAPGAADLIGIVDGRFCALEVKRPGERATEEQERFLQLVRRYNGFAAVVHSVEEAIAAIGRCKAGERD